MSAKLDMAFVGRLMQQVQSEGQLVAQQLRDKGSKRFERPLLVGFILVLGAYWCLYLPPQRKLKTLHKRIETAKQMSESVGIYKDLRDRLRLNYEKLPPVKLKDQFLAQAVVQTLKAEGLTSESIRPPEETLENGLLYQKLSISANVKFTEFMGWLARLESSKPLLHVYSIELAKSKQIGYCTIRVGVGTIVPASDLTR